MSLHPGGVHALFCDGHVAFVGDRVRLADTDLLIEVTEDRSGGPGLAGEEAVFGGGKVIRESMGQGRATRADGAPDLVITGAVVLDHWGVVKADVGVRDGRIVALGKAGNPDTMDGVHPDLPVLRDPDGATRDSLAWRSPPRGVAMIAQPCCLA